MIGRGIKAEADEYQTLKGVCFFEARWKPSPASCPSKYQTLKGVCFFEAKIMG